MTVIKLITVCSFFFLLCSCETDDLKTAKLENTTGVKLYGKGDYKKALYFFMKAAGHKNLPDSNKAIFLGNIAHSYSKMNQPDSAKFFYKKASGDFNPNSSYFNINMANAFLIDTKIDSALKYLEEAYKVDSSSGE